MFDFTIIVHVFHMLLTPNIFILLIIYFNAKIIFFKLFEFITDGTIVPRPLPGVGTLIWLDWTPKCIDYAA